MRIGEQVRDSSYVVREEPVSPVGGAVMCWECG